MMKLIYGAVSGVAVAALLGMTWYVTSGDVDRFAQCRIGQVGVGAGAIGGPFNLVNENGEPVTEKDIITKPTLVYFGYTFCPDACPLDNARNAETLRLLQGKGYDVQAAFVSIDPVRDTPEVMADFTSFIHDDMIGLTGSVEQVKAASQAYKTYFRKQESDVEDDEYYLMDHSTFTYLMFPEMGFADFFRRDESPATMSDRVACFIDAVS